MDNDIDSSPQRKVSKDIPTITPLIGTEPPPVDFKRRWRDVREAEHLPRRLFIGDLVPGSFQRTSGGWQADYRGGELFRLRLSRQGDRIHVEEGFQATPVSQGSFSADRQGAECLQDYVRDPAAFDSVLASYYSNQSNVVYVPLQPTKQVDVLCGFPDGFLQTVIRPIPFLESWHSKLVDILADLAREKSLPFHGLLKTSMVVVNHQVERRGEITKVVAHWDWLYSRGYLPVKRPYWHRDKRNNQTLVSSYLCHVLWLTFAPRYGPQVTACLKRHGALGEPGANPGELAFLMHAHEAATLDHIAGYTPDRSRRSAVVLNCEDEPKRGPEPPDASAKPAASLREVKLALDSALTAFCERRNCWRGLLDIIVRNSGIEPGEW